MRNPSRICSGGCAYRAAGIRDRTSTSEVQAAGMKRHGSLPQRVPEGIQNPDGMQHHMRRRSCRTVRKARGCDRTHSRIRISSCPLSCAVVSLTSIPTTRHQPESHHASRTQNTRAPPCDSGDPFRRVGVGRRAHTHHRRRGGQGHHQPQHLRPFLRASRTVHLRRFLSSAKRTPACPTRAGCGTTSCRRCASCTSPFSAGPADASRIRTTGRTASDPGRTVRRS